MKKILLTIFFLLLCCSSLFAEYKKVHITADKLSVNTADQKNAEFLGNVEAVVDDTVITAESLKIFFKKNADKNTGDSIEKIIASKNVKIKKDDILATCDRAIYIKDTDIIELSGASPTVVKGKNVISGKTIIINRKTNDITAEKGAEKRVEVFLYSEEK